MRDFVENLFLFRLRLTASQTDEPWLRKGQNTERTLFLRKTGCTFAVTVSVRPVAREQFNQKLSYFYHKLFRSWSIEWQLNERNLKFFVGVKSAWSRGPSLNNKYNQTSVLYILSSIQMRVRVRQITTILKYFIII